MKALFNGWCDTCGEFRPHCATVFLRRDGKAAEYGPRPVTMCTDCRKGPWRGRFRADDRHKPGG